MAIILKELSGSIDALDGSSTPAQLPVDPKASHLILINTSTDIDIHVKLGADGSVTASLTSTPVPRGGDLFVKRNVNTDLWLAAYGDGGAAKLKYALVGLD